MTKSYLCDCYTRFLTITFGFLFLVMPHQTVAQIIDIRNDREPGGAQLAGNGPADRYEIFKSGQFEIGSRGQTRGTANVLRYRIGESDAFNVPFWLVLSSPSVGFGDINDAELALADLIVPTGGIFNAALSDSRFILKTGAETELSVAYHLGYKLVNAADSMSGDRFLLSSGFADVGLRFVTGAWVEGEPERDGVFYAQVKGFVAGAGEGKLARAIDPSMNTALVGLALDAGLFINETIDFRINLSRAFVDLEQDDTRTWVIRFSLAYSGAL